MRQWLVIIPFALIVGGKEEETGTVSVREHTKGDIGTKTLEEITQMFIELSKAPRKKLRVLTVNLRENITPT